MPEPMLIDNGHRVELTLISVFGPHQQRGYASRALRMLTALCDTNGVTIELVARRLGASLEKFAPGCPCESIYRAARRLVHATRICRYHCVRGRYSFDDS